MSTVTEPANGWHWREWSAELAGTAILMFAVVTAKDIAVRLWPTTGDFTLRVTLVGTVAGLIVIAVAYSPLGRRSGAHLNPAVTLGLAAQKTVGTADVAGYVAAQLLGALLGVAAARLWGPSVAAPAVHWALIAPGEGITTTVATIVEAAATAAQLAIVFVLLHSPRWARWAPIVAAVLLSTAIVALAAISGAGFNPARAWAPDVLAAEYPGIWAYVVGPVAGALIAAALSSLDGRPVTGKLVHDPNLMCHMRCALPHTPAAVSSPDGSPHRRAVLD
ncbi:MIP/aquaporin family protein [Nocardia sp. NPDC004722]